MKIGVSKQKMESRAVQWNASARCCQKRVGYSDCVQCSTIIKTDHGVRDNEARYEELGKYGWSGADRVRFREFIAGGEKELEIKDCSTKRFFIYSIPTRNKLDFYKMITPEMKGKSNYWIGWPAHCTGDLPSMATALLMGFPHGIRIFSAQRIAAGSKLNEVSSYLGGVVDGDVILTDAGLKGCVKEQKIGDEDIKYSHLTRVVAAGKYLSHTKRSGITVDVSESLEDAEFQNGYTQKARENVRKAWLGYQDPDASIVQKIKEWLESYLKIEVDDRIVGKNIEILWIRKSGERGGAHYENDTSFSAVANYIKMGGADVYILAGDRKEQKAQDIVRQAGGKVVYDFTEFWKNSTKENLEVWGGDTRSGQFRLYDYLNRIAAVKHIGSMSGGLEALALLGHQVSFKAKAGEMGVKRMEQYAGHDNQSMPENKIRYMRSPFFVKSASVPGECDNRGFEKSSAKFFVFFSSGVVQGQFEMDQFIDVFCNEYNPTQDYKVNRGGLCGSNAENARIISHFLSKVEKSKDCPPIYERYYERVARKIFGF